MFTGIIEALGIVRKIDIKSQAIVLSIDCKNLTNFSSINIGDSIAVNGTCLTVIDIDNSVITTDVMPETFRKTNLSKLNLKDEVNLERAMLANGRFDGHIITGHIETVVTIQKIIREENAIIYEFDYPNSISNYLVDKGCIALNGISLTIIEVQKKFFSVALIPHTAKVTNLGKAKVGDLVNVEPDILAKYIEKNLLFKKNKKNEVPEVLLC